MSIFIPDFSSKYHDIMSYNIKVIHTPIRIKLYHFLCIKLYQPPPPLTIFPLDFPKLPSPLIINLLKLSKHPIMLNFCLPRHWRWDSMMIFDTVSLIPSFLDLQITTSSNSPTSPCPALEKITILAESSTKTSLW